MPEKDHEQMLRNVNVSDHTRRGGTPPLQMCVASDHGLGVNVPFSEVPVFLFLSVAFIVKPIV